MNKMIMSIYSIILFVPLIVFGQMEDGTYKITVDNVGFAGGAQSDDGTYQLMDTIGEPIVGVGASTNYQSQAGFWYMVNNTLSLVIDSNTQDLGAVVAGVPNTGSTTATVTTDAWGGYNLLISQNHDMTHTVDAGTTIAPYAGTIAVPTTWAGTGLGFTVDSGTDVEAKWGTSPKKYAGISNVDTVFHTKTGYTSGGDVTVVGYQIDVPTTQKSGVYTNTLTYTAISQL